MTCAYHHDEGERIPRTALAVILFILMIFARCSQCRGQELFRFNTSTVVMVDTAGQMDVGSASWPVIASGDSLLIGCPARPLLWHRISWVKMDDGSLHFLSPFFQAHYLPGPGGQSLYVRLTGGAIREMEFYERETWKQ
jgi:hypothetical protein